MYLVRMLDVYAKAELLEDASLGLDDLIFGLVVVFVDLHGLYEFASAN